MWNNVARIASLVLIIHVWLSAAQGAEKIEKAAQAKKAKPEGEFLRVRRNDAGKAVAMETAIVRYTGTGKYEGATVDLIGAIHVGEGTYYDELNKRFGEYDALLFELVAPKESKFPKVRRWHPTVPSARCKRVSRVFWDLSFNWIELIIRSRILCMRICRQKNLPKR